MSGSVSEELLRIKKAENILSKYPQIDLETNHYFCKGLYAREIIIPINTILTGKMHKEEQINIISKGRIIVWTENGMKEVSSGTVLVSGANVKRIGYTLEDTVWVTMHPNPLDDLSLTNLEARLINNDLDDKLFLEVERWLGLQSR